MHLLCIQVLLLFRDCQIHFSDEAIVNYEDLLDKIKTAVPYIQNIPSEKICIVYKDVTLSTCSGEKMSHFQLAQGKRKACSLIFCLETQCFLEKHLEMLMIVVANHLKEMKLNY